MVRQRSDFQNEARSLDELIRQGRAHLARARLLALPVAQVPRPLYLEYANLARRSGAWSWGIRLLRPLIYRKFPHDQASEDEVATYAGILIKMGLFFEADRLLLAERGDSPLTHLYRAFNKIGQWNQAAAIPPLRKYLEGVEEPYSRTMAEMNLASCLISIGQIDAAITLIAEIHQRSKQHGWRLFLVNSLELLLRVQALRPEYPLPGAIRSWIEDATNQSGLEAVEGVYRVFFKKWLLIRDLRLNGERNHASLGLERLREEAEGLGHFETLRDIDFHLAVLNQNREQARHVYFGTPYPSFRRGVLSAMPDLDTRDGFIWSAKAALDASNILDLASGRYLSGDVVLTPGNTVHRCLVALTSDFYRPSSHASLFNLVYPTERFDPDHSPDRVHKTLKRLREAILSHGAGLSVVVHRGAIRVDLRAGWGLRLESQRAMRESHPGAARVSEALKVLSSDYQGRTFTTEAASNSLQLSLRQTRKYLSLLTKKGKLARLGSSRSIRYRLR